MKMRDKLPIVQFTDTYAEWDVTGLRSVQEYDLICNELWIENPWVKLIWSTPWNSIETAQQVVWYLRELEKQWSQEPQVIAINNASRAKYENLENAKWSDCLVCKVRSTKNPDIVHTIPWVDHECIEEIFRFWNIESIQIVKWIQYNGQKIDDLSQGSQFRSLEFHPFVHGVYLKWQEAVDKYLILEDVDSKRYNELRWIEWTKNNLIKNLWLSLSYNAISHQHTKVIENDFLNNSLKNQENLQLVWQQSKFYDRWWIENSVKDDYRKSLAFENWLFTDEDVKNFRLRRDSLNPNELSISSRDHYWNSKSMTANNIIDWVNDISDKTSLELWKIISVSNWSDKILWSWYLANSIWEHTWENTIWTWSSEFDWMRFVELNRSFWWKEWNAAREEIRQKPIGTKLKLSEKTT